MGARSLATAAIVAQLVACPNGGDSLGDLPSSDATPTRDGGNGGDATYPNLDADSDTAATDATSIPSDGGIVGDGGRDLSADRSKFFGSSRCTAANVQLCEDFESGVIDSTTWKITGTPPAIETAQHARGSKALHIKITGSGASYIRETKTFPARNNDYHGRMFVYFQSLPVPLTGYDHWTILAASNSKASTGEIRVGSQFFSGRNLWGVGTDSAGSPGGTGDWTRDDNDPPGSPVPVASSKWNCVEWFHQGSKNETFFWLDGVSHPSLHTTSTIHGGNANAFILPQFDNVWVGWQEYNGNPGTFEVWIDEVAIDTNRIGCVL